MTATKPKNPEKLFPLFVTDKLEETKRYYLDKLGFEATVDQPEYLQVRYGAAGTGPELCFMRPDAMPNAAPRPAFAGEGVIVSVPTDNADSAWQRMQKKGARVDDQPTDKPWGWRSFFVRDPNGVVLDFFHVYKEQAM